MTQPDTGPGTDVAADPEHLEEPDATLTTHASQREDDLDPNQGEGGSG